VLLLLLKNVMFAVMSMRVLSTETFEACSPGESFDEYLVALRDLVKTCNFCWNGCAQKNIRDQIIECLNDGEIFEDLFAAN